MIEIREIKTKRRVKETICERVVVDVVLFIGKLFDCLFF